MAEQQEKMTIEDLAGKVDTLAKSIEELAGMTQRGFTDQAKRMDTVEDSQTLLKDGQERIEGKLALLEYGQKETRTEIANLTILIQKSSNEEEIVTLKHRVTLLEAQLAK
jgi:hypothetical protein